MFKICKLIEAFDDYNIQDIQQKNGFKTLVQMYSHDNNGSITDFVKTYGSIKLSDFTRNNHPITKSQYFVNHFADQLPYKFYSSDQTTICDKEFTFCKTDGSCYTEKITIEYSVLPWWSQELQENNNEFELSGAHVGTCRASEFMYV